MSIQLIVYPQSYDGKFSEYAISNYHQYVSDYHFSSGFLGSGHTTTSTDPGGDTFANVLPIGVWNHWRTTGGLWGTAPAPSFASPSVLRLGSSASTTSSIGIFQLIQNLTPGSQYDLNIDVNASAGTGGILIGHHSSWTFGLIPFYPIGTGGQLIAATTGVHTHTFTADHATMVLVLAYYNDDGSNLDINKVSIQENLANVPTTSAWTDGSVIVDLYDDTSIPLTLSIDNFKNVAEKSQSYSKAFNLPATKRNNKIFSSLYEVTRSVKNDLYSFNPYRKTKAVIKDDSYTIFEGYLKLIKIVEKEDEISYDVNLFSESVTLADTLKGRKFKDLNFDELNHLYDKDSIKQSFTGDLPISAVPAGYTGYMTDDNGVRCTGGEVKTDVLKYPWVKWNGNSYVNGSTGKVHLTKLEDAFRPWIRCKYLWDMIIGEAGFTYNSDFINSSKFTRLFMDFNWGADAAPMTEASTWFQGHGYNENFATTSFTPLELNLWNNGLTIIVSPATWDFTNFRFESDTDNHSYSINYTFNIQNADSSSHLAMLNWVHKDGSGNTIQTLDAVTQTISAGQTYQYTGNISVILDDGETLGAQFKADANSVIRQPSGTLSTSFSAASPNSLIFVSHAISHMTSSALLNTKRGSLDQWEFIKGLINMFNLIILQDNENPTNLIIEPYTAVFVDDSESQYITSKTVDWTNKVDISEITLNPLKINKITNFNYVDDNKDYPLGVYLTSTGNHFGNYSAVADNIQFSLLDGEKKIEAKPFAATMCRPAFDTFTPELTIPVIYSMKSDGTFEGFDNKPRILYDVSHTTNLELAADVYKIPAQNGKASEFQDSFCQFAHISEIPTTGSTVDYNFGPHQLVASIGLTPPFNLFSEYWAPYYDELYNPDTREMKIKVLLTPIDITGFNFYDRVIIKNREYRVNKIDYKPNELSTVEFILIG